MTLTTRCPECGTTFKVVPDQLRMRNGLVRCGECAAVFDGNANLVGRNAPPSAGAPAVLRSRAAMSRPAEPGGDSGDVPDEGDDAVADRGDDGDIDEAGDAGELDRLDDEPADDDREAGRFDDDDDRFGGAATDPVIGEHRPHARYGAMPEFMDAQAARRRVMARRLWGMAALAALLALAVQLLVVFRVSVVTAVPPLRPVLVALCQPFGCTVGYERRAERISIMSSSLQPAQAGIVEEGQPSRLVLDVVLRNRYLHPQHWPALVLDLRDFSDTVVVSKVLMPAAYLPPDVAAEPLPAGAEVGLSIPLVVEGVRVSGYQVDKFYP